VKCISKGVEMETKAKIKEVLVQLLKVRPEELKDDVSLQDGIGVDSTEMVEAVIALEKAFGTKIDPNEITKFSTINEIEKVIQSKISS
jgi:acyl carrier protein